MKKQFIFILLFFWGFHFFLPFIYFLFFGYVNLYSSVQGYDGMVVNTVAIFGTIAVIFNLPSKDFKFEPRYSNVMGYFFITVFIALLKFFNSGGFEGMLKGDANGSFLSFLSLFFDFSSAFIFLLCFQKKISNIIFIICLYIVVMTMMGSRSSVIGIIIVALILPLYQNGDKIGEKLKKVMIVCAFLSPFLFVIATSIRGGINRDLITKIIIGRISFVELSMIPIDSKERKTMDEKLFLEKYSVNNQIKQVVNVISPIDPFKYDIAPNQYYRSIFMGMPISNVQNSYMSINFTLPVYFVTKTNKIVGVILTIIFLSLVYLLLMKSSKNQYVFLPVILSLYNILYFFDWVMIAQVIFTIVLSLFTLNYYNILLNSIVYTFKKYFIVHVKSHK